MTLRRVNKPGGSGLPDPDDSGHVLISLDGVEFESHKPLVGLNVGWLSDADGNLLVEGWHANG